MAQRIQLRRDSAADWTSANPTLSSGEIGVETDTGKIKVGDGATAWASLAYLGGTGDLVAANNLSDVVSAATARTNLGLAIGTDVQAYDADLADLAAISDAQGDIIVRGASGWERLAKSSTATDVLTAGASQPTWAAASGGGLSNLDYDYATVSVGPSSSAETTIYTYDITAGEPQAGDLYELTLAGDLINTSGSSVTYTFRVKLGATTVIESQALGVGNGPLGRRRWEMQVKIFVASATAQRVSAYMVASAADTTNGPALVLAPSFVGYNSATEDTSTSKTFAVTAQLGSSSISADLRCHTAHLRRLSNF